MAKETKKESAREAGAESRIDAEGRPSQEMEHEVAQRGGNAGGERAASKPSLASEQAPKTKQTSGYGGREDRENPAAGLGQTQSGEGQSQELPSQGFRKGDDEQGRAMSQNGARISDFEEGGRASSR